MTERISVNHKVFRCTDTKAAEAKLDEVANAGYQIVAITSGGADGNVLWIVARLETVIRPVERSSDGQRHSGLIGPGQPQHHGD